MITWFTKIVPLSIINLITPIFLIIIGHLVEKNYVGRITIFTNMLALNIFFHSVSIPELLGLYLNVGIIFGVIGLVFYFLQKSLPSWYYFVGFIFSSVPVGAILFYYTMNPIPTIIITNSTSII